MQAVLGDQRREYQMRDPPTEIANVRLADKQQEIDTWRSVNKNGARKYVAVLGKFGSQDNQNDTVAISASLIRCSDRLTNGCSSLESQNDTADRDLWMSQSPNSAGEQRLLNAIWGDKAPRVDYTLRNFLPAVFICSRGHGR